MHVDGWVGVVECVFVCQNWLSFCWWRCHCCCWNWSIWFSGCVHVISQTQKITVSLNFEASFDFQPHITDVYMWGIWLFLCHIVRLFFQLNHLFCFCLLDLWHLINRCGCSIFSQVLFCFDELCLHCTFICFLFSWTVSQHCFVNLLDIKQKQQ